MTSMTAWPASCRTALVTSSLVSRRAASWSTGTCQDRMAARTRRRASAAAAGPVASRTRDPCRLASRAAPSWSSGFLPAPAQPVREASGQLARCSMSVDIDASIDATCIARHRSADGYWFSWRRRLLSALLEGTDRILECRCIPRRGYNDTRSLLPPDESHQRSRQSHGTRAWRGWAMPPACWRRCPRAAAGATAAARAPIFNPAFSSPRLLTPTESAV